MKIKLLTALLLIACGLGIGWLAYMNIMWAVWGKQNSWYEYIGFWGCPIMFASGIVALKTIKWASYIGVFGYALMCFYYVPALNNALRQLAAGSLELNPIRFVYLALIIALPLLTLVRLLLNLYKMHSEPVIDN